MNDLKDKQNQKKTMLILFICYIFTLCIALLSSFLFPSLNKDATGESLRRTIYMGFGAFLIIFLMAPKLKGLITGIVISILFIIINFIAFGLRYVRIPIN